MKLNTVACFTKKRQFSLHILTEFKKRKKVIRCNTAKGFRLKTAKMATFSLFGKESKKPPELQPHYWS